MKPLPLLMMIIFFHLLFICHSGESVTPKYINSHKFVVTIAPADEESRAAKSADLYQSVSLGSPWFSLGRGDVKQESGGPLFLKSVEVSSDGIYYYLSLPIVKSSGSDQPPNTAHPQAIIVVDTHPPSIDIFSPTNNSVVTAGDSLTISWSSEDRNLSSTPVLLEYSSDLGSSWHTIAHDQGITSHFTWRLPDFLRDTILLKATVTDLASNRGFSLLKLQVFPNPHYVSDDANSSTTLASPLPSLSEQAVNLGVSSKDSSKDSTTVAGSSQESTKSQSSKRINKNASWISYVMAINLVKQNRPQDALQYYWQSVSQDPTFVNAWADLSLIYRVLGAYKTSLETLSRAQELSPNDPSLLHLEGEIYQFHGLSLLKNATSVSDRSAGKDLINKAVSCYSKALDIASDNWQLSEQAATFFRLGEICYFINFDKQGARAYWEKILELYTPTPNKDPVIWSSPQDKLSAETTYEYYTYNRLSLSTWQNWARGYLQQLAFRDRSGIIDISPFPSNSSNFSSIYSSPFKDYPQFNIRDIEDNIYLEEDDSRRSIFSLSPVYGTEENLSSSVINSRTSEDFSRINKSRSPRGRLFKKRSKRSIFSHSQEESLDNSSNLRPDHYLYPGSSPAATWQSLSPYGNTFYQE